MEIIRLESSYVKFRLRPTESVTLRICSGWEGFSVRVTELPFRSVLRQKGFSLSEGKVWN